MGKSIICEPFKGNNKLMEGLRVLVTEKYNKLFNSVFVHGSVATEEIMTYSDFDGLMIVKDKYKESHELKSFKRESMAKIYEFDPLQHHGWFEIFESELNAYPQIYFPYELFEYSKTIYPPNEYEFTIHLNDNYDYLTPLLSLCNSILKKIEYNRPRNMYTLKGLLSQFMLLPALYCQARDQKGIFKKFSFNSAKEDFSDEEWQIMDKVSEIRRMWHYDINSIQKKALSTRNRYVRKLFVPAFSPAIPEDIKRRLNDDFFREMEKLTLTFKSKV